ncbi:DNA repair protein RadC [Roseivirga sp. E12]|uniref:RadC family protein n=1 Tax=Roseivirga sp. E12 TaxID=2819237 RepID=UPI001ABCAC7D|nr:DNA repair protein RadC [Roseivirga sp. E12]MBO3699205.1 DNA repair protein RadC [Roseivirga sp. E12]
MSERLGILSWAEEDRPREKLQLKGKAVLSEAELIAILIGSGSRTHSAVELAKQILSSVNNDLNQLAKLSLQDLTKFSGIGDAKAISIVSALELGRRRKDATIQTRPQIRSSLDAYRLMKPELMDQPTEQFWIIMVSRSNRVIQKKPISLGGISGTLVDPKVIFKMALESLASGIILIHNHPSGNKKPSTADIRLTEKVKKAGQLLEIPVLDHIIFTDDGFLSFADENMM